MKRAATLDDVKALEAIRKRVAGLHAAIDACQDDIAEVLNIKHSDGEESTLWDFVWNGWGEKKGVPQLLANLGVEESETARSGRADTQKASER